MLLLVRIGTREIHLEGNTMNFNLYALNLRYQQYTVTYKSYVLVYTIKALRRLAIEKSKVRCMVG